MYNVYIPHFIQLIAGLGICAFGSHLTSVDYLHDYLEKLFFCTLECSSVHSLGALVHGNFTSHTSTSTYMYYVLDIVPSPSAARGKKEKFSMK